MRLGICETSMKLYGGGDNTNFKLVLFERLRYRIKVNELFGKVYFAPTGKLLLFTSGFQVLGLENKDPFFKKM